MPVSDYFTPGQVAERFDLTLDTLRYYEKAGVLGPVERAGTGHRRYRAADVELLDVVCCLRGTGMSVAAVRRFSELVRGGDATVTDRIALLAEHEAQLADHIAVLHERQRHIRDKIAHYRRVLDGES